MKILKYIFAWLILSIMFTLIWWRWRDTVDPKDKDDDEES